MWNNKLEENYYENEKTKEKEMTENVECKCGRSPTGFCIGWHALTEKEYQEKIKEHGEKEENNNEDDQKICFYGKVLEWNGSHNAIKNNNNN